MLGLFLCGALSASAQDNAIKLNLSLPKLILSNSIGLTYERKLADALAVNASFNFSSKQAAPLSGALTDLFEPILTKEDITTDIFNNKFSSVGFGFQLKYFPKKEALKGFYLAPYFGYQSSGIDPFNFSFPDSDNPNVTHGGIADINLNVTGVGIGLGNQWIIADVLAIDIMWIGLGYGVSNLNIKGTEQPGEDIDFAKIDADVQNFLNTTDEQLISNYADNVTTEYTNDYIKASVKQGIPYTRFLNFSIGYSF